MLPDLWKELTESGLSVEKLKSLVEKGEADVKETDCDGNNILHKVCSLDTEYQTVVDYLISVGSAINQVNREGETPLIVCAGQGHLETLKTLLNAGAYVNYHRELEKFPWYTKTAILIAVEKGHLNCATELLKFGADIWIGGNAVLDIACEKNFPPVVKHCIEHAKCSDRGDLNSAMEKACVNGNVECVKLILTVMKGKGLGVYKVHKPPILEAASAGKEDCIIEMLDHGFEIFVKDRGGKNLVMLAARRGLLKALRRCLEKAGKAEFTHCDWKGRTCIMHACKGKQLKCLELLLQSENCSQYMINKMSKIGYNAVMICAEVNFPEGLALLIRHKALVNQMIFIDRPTSSNYGYANTETNSALLLAANSQAFQCVRLLVDNGAGIWYENKKGLNLLMEASAKGMADVVKYCLTRGDPSQIIKTDRSGKTALHHAYDNNQIDCMKLLLGSGVVKDEQCTREGFSWSR